MKENTILLKNLSIGYKYKKLLKIVGKNISSSIKNRELTCLVGANGAGKSTLLRTLCAFQPKLDGEIFISGKEISDYEDKEISKKIGVVLTERINIQNMSVYELVSMGRSPYTGFWGTMTEEDKRIVDEAIASVKIEGFTDRMIQTLSDGERQKVMIAKALAQETPVIFLDEPTAFLDFPSKVEIMQLLHHLTRKQNKTILLSTHDLELALQIADKIWLMSKDEGIKTGTPEDLTLQGAFNSFFNFKGITFDIEFGLFKIINNFSSEIGLIGDGTKYSMVKKALHRIGILTNNNTAGIFIDAGNNNDTEIKIHINENRSIKVNSIEEMIDSLQHFH